MKKLIAAASLIAMMGLGFYGYSTTNVDSLLGTEETGEKTYIVRVAGNVSGEGKEAAAKNRQQVLNELGYKLEENSYEVTHVYDTVYNGFAIKTTAANANILANTLNVTNVTEAHVYAAPEDTTTPGAELNDEEEALVRSEKLANYSASTMHATEEDVINAGATSSQKGRGITIGILDTGMYLNQVEGTAARAQFEIDHAEDPYGKPAFVDLQDKTNMTLTKEKIEAAGFEEGYSYTYLNDKLPFCYDFAGNDTDVDPTTAGSDHGTHVASLAGGNGEDFQGVAPLSQICVMKVFGDSDGGAGTPAILAALDAAVKLGLDEINMSLGTDLVDNSDTLDGESYLALKAASDAGVICNISAGNAGKSSFSSGDYSDYTTDTCEQGMLGSYANFDEAANIVASSNPDTAFYSSIMNIQRHDSDSINSAAYSDQIKTSTTQTFDVDRAMTDLLSGSSTGSFDYVYVPGFGTSADYDALGTDALKGKVAVVNRGNTTFVAKTKAAEAHGATALVVINNDPAVTFNFTMAFSDYSPSIPVCFVFQNTTTYWGNHKTLTDAEKADPKLENSCGWGTVSLSVNTVADASDGNMISSYSSDGPSANLDIGPTLSAPGSAIIGAVNATTVGETSEIMGYDNYSGTSMAAPNLTGAMAVVLGEKHPGNDSTFKLEDADAFRAYKDKLSLKAMSTADQLIGTDKAAETSVRLQGAGRINSEAILASDAYITSPNTDLGGYTNENQSKVELKNSGSLYVENADFTKDQETYIEFDYTIHNDSKVAKTYEPSISVQIPQLRVKLTHEAYAAEEAESRSQEVGYDADVTFDANDPSTYPTFTGVPTISVNDDNLTDGYLPMDETITVPANGTVDGKVKFRIDNLEVSKDFGDGDYTPAFNGTLKEYAGKYFANAGGLDVEGFLKLHESGEEEDLKDLTIPYLGFYGDYTLGAAVEDFDFEKDSSHIYNSDLTDNYLQNLADQYAKPNAYTGSTLFATGSAISSSDLNKIGAFTKAPLANGSDYLSVTGKDEANRIYAGASGVSDHLTATFFVNRSLSDASWKVTNDKKTVASGPIGDLFDYTTGTFTVANNQGIAKSWLSTNDTGYSMHRGYAAMDLSKVAEGDYTLTFSFTLFGTGTTQTKSYPLTIDKSAPTLAGLSVEEREAGSYLTVKANGANDAIKVGSVTRVPTKNDDGTYQVTSKLSTKNVESDKVVVTLSDYAHNSCVIIVHPSDLQFSVGSTFFTDNNNYYITEFDPANHGYTVSIVDKNDKEIEKLSGSYVIYASVEKGLTSDDIAVTVDGDDATFDYYPETGIVVITMPKDASFFSLTVASSTPEPTPETSSVTSSSAEEKTSSSSGSSETKKGCGGSVIAASSTVGALALLGSAIALKKKREDK